MCTKFKSSPTQLAVCPAVTSLPRITKRRGQGQYDSTITLFGVVVGSVMYLPCSYLSFLKCICSPPWCLINVRKIPRALDLALKGEFTRERTLTYFSSLLCDQTSVDNHSSENCWSIKYENGLPRKFLKFLNSSTISGFLENFEKQILLHHLDFIYMVCFSNHDRRKIDSVVIHVDFSRWTILKKVWCVSYLISLSLVQNVVSLQNSLIIKF